MRDLDKPYSYLAYPFVSKGPEGEEQVFDSEGEVPAGWTLPEGGVKGGKAKTVEKPKEEGNGATETVTSTSTANSSGETPEVDAAGVAWDPSLHAATKTKTQAGLWRMKVGVKRPEGQDAPKPALDL